MVGGVVLLTMSCARAARGWAAVAAVRVETVTETESVRQNRPNSVAKQSQNSRDSIEIAPGAEPAEEMEPSRKPYRSGNDDHPHPRLGLADCRIHAAYRARIGASLFSYLLSAVHEPR